MESERTVREETNAVSGTTVKMSVQNRHQKPLHPLNHEHKEEEVRRGKRTSEAQSLSWKFARQPCKDHLKGFCTKSPCDYWHPPECQLHKSEMGCKFGDKCSFPHRKVEEQPNKRPKKGGDKSAVAVVKGVRQLELCIRGH